MWEKAQRMSPILSSLQDTVEAVMAESVTGLKYEGKGRLK